MGTPLLSWAAWGLGLAAAAGAALGPPNSRPAAAACLLLACLAWLGALWAGRAARQRGTAAASRAAAAAAPAAGQGDIRRASSEDGMISALYIHPIKSCRGIAVNAATLTEAGLRYDREWMVVQEEGGRFLSQRATPRMALIVPSLPAEALVGAAPPPGAVMTVTAPGQRPLRIPLQPGLHQAKACSVWDWKGSAMDEGDEAAAWFTEACGMPCRLVRYVGTRLAHACPPGTTGPLARLTDPEFAQGYETGFTDGFQMLLANEASLVDLNRRMAAHNQPPITITRFRPNIVVSGLQPWAEDQWRTVTVFGAEGHGEGPIALTSVKPCSRCKVPTVNPETGLAEGEEPTTALSTFRRGQDLGFGVKSWKWAVFFGWNLVAPASANGRQLRVGDRLRFSGSENRLPW